MKNSMKKKLAKTLGNNMEWNKKALQIKKSWDEVDGILKSTAKTKDKKK